MSRNTIPGEINYEKPLVFSFLFLVAALPSQKDVLAFQDITTASGKDRAEKGGDASIVILVN